jgi:hypothetical protein
LRPLGKGETGSVGDSILAFAVVDTVTSAVDGVVPFKWRELGLIVHVAPAGAPAQLKVNVPAASTGVNASVYVAVCPAATACEVDEPLAGPALKSSADPERVMLSGLPEALSVTRTVPVRTPPTVGVNVTLIVHSAPAATLELQVFDSAKSPPVVIALMLKALEPVLARTTVCGRLVVPTG